jgi:hypothetical protein
MKKGANGSAVVDHVIGQQPRRHDDSSLLDDGTKRRDDTYDGGASVHRSEAARCKRKYQI